MKFDGELYNASNNKYLCDFVICGKRGDKRIYQYLFIKREVAITYLYDNFPCEDGEELEYWKNATEEEKKRIGGDYWRDFDLLFNDIKAFALVNYEDYCYIFRESDYNNFELFLKAVIEKVEDLYNEVNKI